jgi:hypothetical protein
MKTVETQPTIWEQLRSAPVPDWIVKMNEHYRLTGTYRCEDLRRLLGDQRRTVRTGANVDFESFSTRG